MERKWCWRWRQRPGSGDGGAGRGQADKGRDRGRGKGKARGGVVPPPAKSRLSWPSSRVAAGRLDSGGLGVALPCASAKCSRLLLEVFDDCSRAGCRLSLRDGAIIRELNETVLAVKFPETGGIGLVVLSHVKKWKTPSRPQDWHHLHFTVSALLTLTSDHQVLLSLARPLIGDWSRVVPFEVVRRVLMTLLWDR